MHTLVLIRHGESTWNQENRFTGWVDIDLTKKGMAQARVAGEALKKAGFDFDLAFTSVLKRAIRSQWLIFEAMDLMWVPIAPHWRLNERHYGALTSLNKADTAERYGAEQARVWHRSFDIPPPPLDRADARTFYDDPRYAALDQSQIPLTECLKDTVNRVLPLWHESIAPAIRSGKRVIINAHGNSIRALIKCLGDISDQSIAGLDIPNGIPIVHELDEELRVLRRYVLDFATEQET
ncbi:2,3-diphosphoglycerate-dependent phosphoglycerate mutase [Noviherbaspirillum sedimenti]|uniref:2,3-bisphosphoglycerate-dependent phosphoglycerate mutase n=1 Tax=Noviherbaspirillum sedimenti TaxID=2320865 RepID=A0A3A3G926_9BURK|nr:2,3-diphosphoglycerate-dependent phosphoglycerate mutase [Noviherbaspirillum sedimenti]RJG03259.1 2,3-diphosphoglycerate-dependent phosphoglycerate mutase [Noviherbaspirillum sedimenti]